MPSYFEHNAKRAEVALDVVQFEPLIVDAGMHVHEHTDDPAEFCREFSELMERLA